MKPKTLAILGGSGAGKTALSLELASNYDCAILSLDSLSVYQEINIASAKPSLGERKRDSTFWYRCITPQRITKYS